MCCCRQMDMIMTESQAVMKTSLGDLITLTEKVVSFAQALNERSFVCQICTDTGLTAATSAPGLRLGGIGCSVTI